MHFPVYSGVKTESKTDDSDVEIVYETKVSAEEEQEAKKLGLPPKFFAYRQLPDCNCEQCKKDDEYFKDLLKDAETTTVTTNSTIFGTPVSIFTTSHGSSLFSTPNSMFNTPPSTVSPFSTSTTSVFGGGDQKVTPTDHNKSETLKELLIKPSIFDSAGKQKGEGEPKVSEKNKSLFGGENFIPNKTEESVFKSFSFLSGNTTPKTTVAETTKPNVFGGYSFGSSTTSVFSTPTGTASFGEAYLTLQQRQ